MSDVIIDTHAHIYHADETRYPMVDQPYRPPAGAGGIEHLRREREAHGVHRVVLVQTGSAYRWDNRLLADTARQNADWTAGVCNLDPGDPASSAALEVLTASDNVRALRLEAAPDGRYDHEGARRLFQTSRRLGILICAHLRAAALAELDALLGAYPEVPVVLDHCAYPDGADGPEGDTVRAVVDLARHRNLHAKLTFLVTMSKQAWPFVDTQVIARRVLDAFGPERCMWGSDFPCELWLQDTGITYGQHLALVRDELGLSPTARAEVLGGTALRLFFGG